MSADCIVDYRKVCSSDFTTVVPLEVIFTSPISLHQKQSTKLDVKDYLASV